MNQQEIKEILELHRKWLMNEDGGKRADMSGAVLSCADLRGADLSYADLRGADLSYADLRGADLRRADLRRADLSYADLRGADLSYADLRGADLSGAVLSGAVLGDVVLRGADLRGADLRGADLSGTVLSGAVLSGTVLSDAKLDTTKEDFFTVLNVAKNELVGLYKSLLEGRINGSVYEGECACLVGTIAKIRNESFESLTIDLRPDSLRPIERWFMGIRNGDTPENNPISAITKEWIEEFAKAHGIILPVKRIVWVAKTSASQASQLS